MAAEKDGVCGRGAQAPLAQKKLIPPKKDLLSDDSSSGGCCGFVFAESQQLSSPFRFCTCLRSHDRIGVKVDLGLWTFACQRHQQLTETALRAISCAVRRKKRGGLGGLEWLSSF